MPDIVYRPGDRVRVLEPRRFVRCGYPKVPADYAVAAEELYRQLRTPDGQALRFGTKAEGRILDALSYGLAQKDHFGGPERTVHTEQDLSLLEGTYIVQEVRSVKTGRYYPPSGGGTNYWGESDWEPGGLADEKVHRIARLKYSDDSKVRSFLYSLISFAGGGPEVEVCHLEKVP
ncbi:MAG: hypothetical protein WC729_29165 [Sphingomonas sp.]|jgi:hypothetical protein|uniref:hypothetical protein n=1 Tax=Sphingomonas sp. TaxID=28214 RepID=UPI003566B4A7